MKDELKAKRQRLRRHAASTAAVHWQRMVKRIRGGELEAAEYASRFLASDDEARAELAAQFYGEAHVALLAALGDDALSTLMNPWIEDALDWAFGEYEPGQGPESGDRNPERRFIERLVVGQYVAVVQRRDRRVGPSPVVSGWPDPLGRYGDLCALCADGAATGCTLRLFKATGEPFAEQEMAATFQAMRENFLGSAADDGGEESWQFEWVNEGDDDRAIQVEVRAFRTSEPPDADDEDDEEELVDEKSR